MVAGQTTSLPIVVTNNSSGFTFNHTDDGSSWRYRAGYRWFDAKGTLVSSDAIDLPADISSGASSSQFSLPVAAPTAAGQYTLRLDLVHALSGSPTLWSSDWAAPSLYYARDKRSYSPANTRWTGASYVERDDFPIDVLGSGGTAQGPNESVTLGDGSTLGINLWSHDLTLDAAGGVGFNDLLPVELTYGYDEGNSADCTGILQACGWYTNWDERLIAGTNPGAYTYQAPDGNRYLVGTDGNGQMVSSAPVSLQRPRVTLFDDNTLPWTGTTPSYDTTTAYGGSAFSTLISTSTTGGATAVLSPSFSLNNYPTLDFSVKATATTNKGALAVQVKDEATATTAWLGYAFGPAWTIPGMAWQTNIGAPPTNWPSPPTPGFSEYLWHDAYANYTIFGSDANQHDPFSVTSIKLVGGGGTAASLWYDAVFLLPRSALFYDDAQPSWTGGSTYASLNTSDAAVGTASLQVAPTTVANSPAVQGVNEVMGTYPYVSWSWKKVGGTSIAQVFTVEDLRTTTTKTITYYAGQDEFGYLNPIQVSATLPSAWTKVTRDVADDARQLNGFFNDNPSASGPVPTQGPTPDDLQLNGYQLVAFDGAYGLFDDEFIVSQAAIDSPTATTTFDFVATEANGVQHWFNRDGLLEEIIDRDGHAVTLDWTYSTSVAGGGQAAYTLHTVHAPGDGLALSTGTAQRELAVDTTADSSMGVRFTESLGSTTSSTGRYIELDRAAPTAGDLVSVIPARYDAACATGATPQGCLTFGYTGSHLLASIGDPRETSSNNDQSTITYATTDPTTITDANTAQTMLKVVSYDTGTGSGYLRPLWQDQSALEANMARYADLSPDGATLNDYVPKACTGTCAVGSSGTYPAAPGPADLLDSTAFDGLGRPALAIRYRTTGSGSTAGPEIVTRRATNAAAGVDNLNDPLTAAETVWSQTPDEYYAGIASGMADRYRTSYAYNALHEIVDTVSPHLAPLPNYTGSVSAPGNLKGEWRRDETSGSPLTDSSGAGHNGTYSGSPTLGGAGSLVGVPTNKAAAFNGTNQYATVTGSTLGTISGSFTVEAWAKVSGTTSYQDIFGSRGPVNTYGFDLKFNSDGATIHSDIGSGAAGGDGASAGGGCSCQ